jgi:hypothetical protein
MARNGTGQYVAPNSSWNPAIGGVLATAGDWQSLLNDLSAALTQSVSRDGQSPMQGNLNLSNNKITGLAAGTATTDAATWAQLFGASTQADIASAATTDIGVQNTSFLRVTGTTTITSFGTSYRGPRFLTFEGAVTLTHSSTLVLPGGANITTAAGDSLIVIPGATLGTADKWIVVAYQAATGFLKANNPSYTGTLTGGTGVVNIGSGQFYKDASGNVGIGTSSPATKLDVIGTSSLRGTASILAGGVLDIYNTAGTNYTRASVDASANYYLNNPFSAAILFGTNNTERARIDSSGNLLVGTTTAGGGDGVTLGAGFGTRVFARNTTASSTQVRFNNPNGFVGEVTTSGTSTSYATSSDYRLKHDIQPLTGALATVSLLKPVTYKWNADDSQSQGFIAHELQEVVPECVTGEKDAVDAEGNPQYQGIDTSFLVATLAAAIQELKGINDAQAQIITALTARVEALEVV